MNVAWKKSSYSEKKESIYTRKTNKFKRIAWLIIVESRKYKKIYCILLYFNVLELKNI
jgi:hypothetical protein